MLKGMKHFYLFLALGVWMSCASPAPLNEKHATNRLEVLLKKENPYGFKDTKKREEVILLHQFLVQSEYKNLVLSDTASVEDLEKSALLLDRMISRSEEIHAKFPSLVTSEDISAQKALFQKFSVLASQKLWLEIGNHLSIASGGEKWAARRAYDQIEALSKMHPNEEEDISNLFSEALSLGIEKNLMIFTDADLEDYFSNFKLRSGWKDFYTDQTRSGQADIMITIKIDDLHISAENYSKFRECYRDVVQDGLEYYEETVMVPQPCVNQTRTVTKGDSSWTVTECVEQPPKQVTETKSRPRWIEVEGIAEIEEVSKNAYLIAELEFYNVLERRIFARKSIEATFDFFDNKVDYSGDSRLSHVAPMGNFWLDNAPDDDAMFAGLLKHFQIKLEKLLSKDYPAVY